MPQTVVGDVLVLARTVDACGLCCGDLVPLLREMAWLAEILLLGEMPGEMSHTRLALMTGSMLCVFVFLDFGFRRVQSFGFWNSFDDGLCSWHLLSPLLCIMYICRYICQSWHSILFAS